MSKFGWIVKGGLAVALSLSLSACAATFENHGDAPSDAELQEIVVGVDTRQTVAETIGQPSTAGMLDESSWYYVQSRWRNFAYRKPEPVSRELVAIRFDAGGTVRNIERFTLEDGRVVALSRRVTDSNIEGIGLLQQLLGNIGNFSAGDFVDN